MDARISSIRVEMGGVRAGGNKAKKRRNERRASIVYIYRPILSNLITICSLSSYKYVVSEVPFSLPSKICLRLDALAAARRYC